MAKNPKKKSKKSDYETGYKKPPKEHQFKPGQSGNPKGRPKKITSLKEALQISLNAEISTKTETGEIKKITCAEALAKRSIVDAISKDGPTRRMFFRNDIFNLISKEPELEYDEDETELLRVEKEYGKLLKQWAKLSPKLQKCMRKIFTAALMDFSNGNQWEES